jgi:elongation factor Ts
MKKNNIMSIDAKTVKELRDKTGAGMMDCKNALKDSDGNIEQAIDYLRKTGITKAEKKGSRDTKEGIIYSYIHAGGRLGVLIEVNCETDFVAKTDSFVELSHNLAMQIAATNPIALERESIPESVIYREKEIYADQAKSSGKPENIIEKMVDGRMNKFFQENCLMEQAYIKDSEKKILDILTESIATLGENITISRYTRFAVGESDSSNGQI